MLEEVVGHVDRVHEVPPGVDIDEWRPRPRDEALAGLLAEARRDPPNPGNASERLPDEGNAERLAAFLAGDEPTVVYFGKLLYNKGVHVLLEALREVDARAVIVGFGDYRAELEARCAAAARRSSPARSSTAISSTCSPLADVTVVPSIFPEAFGMVAAEAAAAGSPPLVARHSGLAEVADGLEAGVSGRTCAHLARFATGDAGELAREAERAARAARRRPRGAARGRAARHASSAGAGPGVAATPARAVQLRLPRDG